MAQIQYLFDALIIGLSISTSLQCQYEHCSDWTNPDGYLEHTMCKYPAGSFGDQCNEVDSSALPEEHKNKILDYHNELRAKVASGQEKQGLYGPQPAGDIGPLEWDDEIAEVAQRWADQCIFGHDRCRNVGGTYVGQNLGMEGFSDGYKHNYSNIVTAWYDEVADFDYNLIENYQSGNDGKITGHYTQLIWAKTTHVGCGGVEYFADGFYTTHLVCNYKPGGNMYGEPIYETT